LKGTLTFNANLTFTAGWKATGSITVGIPMSCLTEQSLTCDDFNEMFAVNVAADPAILSIDCVSGGIGCTCTEVIEDLPTDRMGTYSTSGTTLSMNPGITNEYCVQGDELHIIAVDTTMNTGPMGQAAITSDVVFRK